MSFNESAWTDVEPIPHSKDEPPVAAIAYDSSYEKAVAVFRAVLKMDERSERAYELTEVVITGCPANYTAWYYRRRVLEVLLRKEFLDGDLSASFDGERESPLPGKWSEAAKEWTKRERSFSEHIGTFAGWKNYQLWHHRRVLTEWDGDLDAELEFVERILSEDTKNYHAWSHRQWAVRRFGRLDRELGYARRMIERDVRNNSAWNHRWFALTCAFGEGPTYRRPLPLDVRRREVDFAIDTSEIPEEDEESSTTGPRLGVLGNESMLNYLRGLLRSTESNNPKEEYPRLWEWSIAHVDSERGKSSEPFLAFCVDLFEQEASTESKAAAKSIVQRLLVIDPVRIRYWKYRLEKLEE